MGFSNPVPNQVSRIPMDFAPEGFIETGWDFSRAHSTGSWYVLQEGPTTVEDMVFRGNIGFQTYWTGSRNEFETEIQTSPGFRSYNEWRTYFNAFWRMDGAPEWVRIQENAIAEVTGDGYVSVTESGVACVRLDLRNCPHGQIVAILPPGTFPEHVRVFEAVGSNAIVTVSPDGFIRAYWHQTSTDVSPATFPVNSAGGFFYPIAESEMAR